MSLTALKRFLSSPKHVALLLIATLALSLLAPIATIYAQSTVPSQSYPLPQTNSIAAPNLDTNVPQNQHTYVQSLFIEVMSSLTCIVAGIDPINPRSPCLGVDQATGKIGYVPSQGGLIGMAGGLIAELYTPPASSSDYIHYLSDNFGITKHTYAADIGTAASNATAVDSSIGSTRLRPLLGIWSAFRNIAYLFFVLAFIIIGFAIMLRLKIDPRTVMTIQNSIPKIIIGLLLITFSYAIAGLMIDMMYTTTYLLFNTIGQKTIITTGQSQLTDARKHFNGENPIGFVNNLLGVTSFASGTSGELGDQVRKLLSVPNINDTSGSFSWQSVLGGATAGALLCGTPAALLGTPAAGLILGGICAVVGGVTAASGTNIVSNGVRNSLAFVFSVLASLGAFLILAIAIVIMLFRLWFILLKAYIMILLDVVLGPLWILAGVIPNSSLRFGSWFRHLTAHLAVFPATIGIFLLARAIMDSFSSSPGGIFVPPLVGNPSGSAISYIIGLGFLMITPTLLDQLRDALKSPSSKYNAEMGRGIGRGIVPFTYLGGKAFARDQQGNPRGPGSYVARVYGRKLARRFLGRRGEGLIGRDWSRMPASSRGGDEGTTAGDGTPPPTRPTP